MLTLLGRLPTPLLPFLSKIAPGGIRSRGRVSGQANRLAVTDEEVSLGFRQKWGAEHKAQ